MSKSFCNVVHEETELLVINKPAGLVVHPGAGNARGTLMNGLLAHVPQLESLPRAGIVHRLDKDTSGVLLLGAGLEVGVASLEPGEDPSGGTTIRDPAVKAALGEALGLNPQVARALPPAYLVTSADDAGRLEHLGGRERHAGIWCDGHHADGGEHQGFWDER